MGFFDAVSSAASGVWNKAKEVVHDVEVKVGIIPDTPPPAPPPKIDTAGAAKAGPVAYNLSDATQRKALIEASGQVNDVSRKAGNENDVCAGAALTNAVVMDCKSPADCARNADAIQHTADKMNAWRYLPPGVDPQKAKDAVQHLRAGSLTQEDAQYLQQVNYAIARSAQGTGNPGQTQGISSGSMYATVGMLRAEGAFTNSEPTFHEANLSNGSAHWTVSSGGFHANSYLEGGPAGKGAMNVGTPAGVKMSRGNPKGQAEIAVKNGAAPDVDMVWRGGTTNSANRVDMNPTDFKASDGADTVRVLRGVAGNLGSPETVDLQ